MKYDSATARLKVWFVSGAVYEYRQVPATAWEEMQQASSKGHYLNTHIKGSYAFKKIK